MDVYSEDFGTIVPLFDYFLYLDYQVNSSSRDILSASPGMTSALLGACRDC